MPVKHLLQPVADGHCYTCHFNHTQHFHPRGHTCLIRDVCDGEAAGAKVSGTMQGKCPKPPSPDFMKDVTGPSLLRPKPGQCLIVSNAPIMNVRHGNLLLDNLYFRRRPQKNHRDMEAFIVQVCNILYQKDIYAMIS